LKNHPILFIIAGFCLAFAGVAAFAFGDLQDTEEAQAGIAIVCVLGTAVLGYGIIRWREDEDAEASTF
jgi:hypothetical protein